MRLARLKVIDSAGRALTHLAPPQRVTIYETVHNHPDLRDEIVVRCSHSGMLMDLAMTLEEAEAEINAALNYVPSVVTFEPEKGYRK